MDGMEVSTLLGGEENLIVSLGDGVKINDSSVIAADVPATNGVIHVIDQVLVPGSIDVPAYLANCKEPAEEEAPVLDIPGTAVAAGVFTTLVTALQTAGLTGTLAEPGPFTVFAPTDDAFSALPDGLVGCLLEPENEQSLKDVLLYHVANGEVLSTDLNDNQQIPTLLNGAELKVDLSGDVVKINESTVITADVAASNGVVHIIDQVLVPPSLNVCGVGGEEESKNDEAVTCVYLGVARSAGQYLTGPTHTCLCTDTGHWINCRPNSDDKKTIEEVVTDSDQLSTLNAAIDAANIRGVLDGPGPFTLFAPTDRAFQKVPTKLLDYLLANENQSDLVKVLQYHVYSGEAKSSAIPYGTATVPTLLGGEDEIDVEKTCWSAVDTCDDTFSITLNDSSYVVAADVSTANGVIHIIEEVLIPPSLADAVQGIIAT